MPEGLDLCLVYAPIITVVVQLCKKIPFVGKNPAVVAGILSLVVNTAGTVISGGLGSINTQLIGCVLTSLGGAVVAHHAVVKPATKVINK